jgi:hypothetical protein
MPQPLQLSEPFAMLKPCQYDVCILLYHEHVQVLKIDRDTIASIFFRNPKILELEAERDLSPIRQFFEQELMISDTAKIGRVITKVSQCKQLAPAVYMVAIMGYTLY